MASSLGKYKDHIGIFLAKEDESVDAAVTRFAAEIQNPCEWIGEEGISLSALVFKVDIAVHDATLKEPQVYRGNIEGATPTIDLFYDGTHYQYLRLRAPSVPEASSTATEA